jgi:nicotinamidase-related amidase
MKDRGTRHKSDHVLLLVDVINHFEFPDGKRLLRRALPIASAIAVLKERARRAGIPSIYVNDNFGQWRSDAAKLVEYCGRPEAIGRSFVEQLRPHAEDYFVLKPMHSAFYQTPLETLLRYLGATSLILCGLATNSCILCTAHDADMRDFRLIVPPDCSAARSQREHEESIRHIQNIGETVVKSSRSIRLRSQERTRFTTQTPRCVWSRVLRR